MNSLITLFFSFILVVFPIFITVFYFIKKNYSRIINRDNDFLAKFGSILEQLNFKRGGRLVLIYTTASVLRKLWLALIVVFQQKHVVFTIFQVNF